MDEKLKRLIREELLNAFVQGWYDGLYKDSQGLITDKRKVKVADECLEHIESNLKKEEEIEFQTLGNKERVLLLSALDFDKDKLACQCCNEKVKYQECCIMPSKNTEKLATILCSSPLCVAEYLEM